METPDAIHFELETTADDDRPVYLVGTFNQWNAKDFQFPMHQVRAGFYECNLPKSKLHKFPMEYKYVKGDWGNEEVDRFGCHVSNRQLLDFQPLVKDYVPRWKKNGLSYQPALLPKIEVIDEAFEIPQLIKTRRIAALLPHDYYTTDKRYPVLYLQDGQNLFEDYAPFGTWAVDKRLAVMAESGKNEVIIIAIDHAHKDRIAEYTPSYKTRIGSGDGKKYARFLTDTLKPYIDKHFRTLPDQMHTGIGGSSMGGLISIYAGIMYPEVYGKLMIFSPSLWVAPNIHIKSMIFPEPIMARIYLYAGEKESETMIPNIRRLKEALEEKGLSEDQIKIKLSIDPRGEHNEERWGKEFPLALDWLYFQE
ncbi:MAG: hypothetical protein KDC44_11375 [Phaeodactylibacter sp.]|nr:hypothetical protein [Phaeodactylibacter sp.]